MQLSNANVITGHQSSSNALKISDQYVSKKGFITMSHHKVLSQCLIKMSGINVSSEFFIKPSKNSKERKRTSKNIKESQGMSKKAKERPKTANHIN